MAKSNVKGLDSFLKYLADSPEKMVGGIGQSLSLSAQVVVEQAKANCPASSGELRSSIRALPVRRANAAVGTKILAGGKAPDGTSINYAHLVEFSGAQPHRIQAKAGGKLAFGGAVVSSVDHPGMKPHPFLRPALDSSETQVVQLIDAAVGEILKG